jgi:hypothetical protein
MSAYKIQMPGNYPEESIQHLENSESLKSRILQSMFKIKKMVKTANEAIAEILKDKYVNLTAIHHLIYAAATVMTEEVIGTGCYKSETQQSKTTHMG